MKTFRIVLISVILMTLTSSVFGQKSKWLWENRSSTVLPSLTEINYVDGVTQPIQQQLGAKADAAMVDTSYYKLENAILGYTAAQVDSSTVGKFKRDIRYLGGPNYVLPVAMISYMSGGAAMTAGTGYYSVYICDETRTLTSATYGFLTTVAVYTGDGAKYNGIAVFRLNMSTLEMTEIGRTTNDTEIWKGALNTSHTKNFTAGISVTKGDVLVVAAVYNSTAQTTAPTLLTLGTVYSNLQAFTTLRLVGSKTGVSDFTNSNMSTIISGSSCMGIWLK